MIQRSETCALMFNVDKHCDFVGMRICLFVVNGTGRGDTAGSLLSKRVT